MNDPFWLQTQTGTPMQRAALFAIAQVRVLVRVTEIRALHTHNLSLVDLSAAWTGQQRFQGRRLAGGKAMARWSIEDSAKQSTGVGKPAVFVAALRIPEELRGRWWVTLQS